MFEDLLVCVLQDRADVRTFFLLDKRFSSECCALSPWLSNQNWARTIS